MNRLPLVVSISAMTIGLGMVLAPPASASPAPVGVERSYLRELSGLDSREKRVLALQLGYLTCALSQISSNIPAGTETYLSAAQDSGMCSYVSAPRGNRSAVKQDLQAHIQQNEVPTENGWTNINQDHDSYTDSNDGAIGDPNSH